MMAWNDPTKAKSALQSAIMGMLGRVLKNQGDAIDQCAKCNAPVTKQVVEPGSAVRGEYSHGRVRAWIVRINPDSPIVILPDDYDPKTPGWFYECEHCKHADGWPWLGARALL